MGLFSRVSFAGVCLLVVGCGGSGIRSNDDHHRVLLVASMTDDKIQTFTCGGGEVNELTVDVDDGDGDDTNNQTEVTGKKDTLFPSLGLAASPQFRLYSATSHGVIEQFRIMGSGKLEYLSPTTAALENGLGGIAVSPDGKWLYATAGPNKVKQYAIATNGTLTPLAIADIIAGANPTDIQITPDGQHAYVANQDDGTISQFSIGADGSLVSLGAPVSTPSGPSTMAIDPSGTHLYAACPQASKIAIYNIGANGSLTHSSDVDSALNAQSVAINASFAYSGSVEGAGEIKQYGISGNSLAEITPSHPTTHADQVRLAISPEGYLYVSNHSNKKVYSYRIAADGTLFIRDSEDTVDDPGPMVFRYSP